MEKQIIKEKLDFIAKNTSYLDYLLENIDCNVQNETAFLYFYNILMCDTSLEECKDYSDLVALIEEKCLINSEPSTNVKQRNILFSVAFYVDSLSISKDEKKQLRDYIREYVKELDVVCSIPLSKSKVILFSNLSINEIKKL